MKRLLLLWLFITEIQVSAQVSEQFIERIAVEERIPIKLLKSVAYVESGFQAWALNVQGKSHIFPTQQAAEHFLEKMLRQGITNIDIGCAQINWHWHRSNFHSPQQLLSPETSLRYAARLLRKHSQHTRSWMKAALLYHSTDQYRQHLYRQRLIRYLRKGPTA